LYLKICNSSENVSTRMLSSCSFFLLISFIYIYIYIADVVEWSRALDKRISDWCCSVSKWCEFKFHRGKKTNLKIQRSNSNTVWFNLQTYIRLKIKPNSVRIIFQSCQIVVLPSTGFELTPLIHIYKQRNCLPFASWWVHPQFSVVFLLLIFSFFGVCLRPVCCLSNVAIAFGLIILDWLPLPFFLTLIDIYEFMRNWRHNFFLKDWGNYCYYTEFFYYK
jgi:hypothetical protein